MPRPVTHLANLERTIRSLGVRTILGTVPLRAGVKDARLTEIELASRYGNVTTRAGGRPPGSRAGTS